MPVPRARDLGSWRAWGRQDPGDAPSHVFLHGSTFAGSLQLHDTPFLQAVHPFNVQSVFTMQINATLDQQLVRIWDIIHDMKERHPSLSTFRIARLGSIRSYAKQELHPDVWRASIQY